MSILASCEVVGDLVIAAGDGSDPIGDGVSLVNPPAWTVSNLGPLWLRGEKRGADVVMPGAVGVRPFRRRLTVTPHTLPIYVSGSYHHTLGQDCDDFDEWEVLQANLSFLDDSLVADPATRPGTRAALLTMPNGEVREADVHVIGLSPARIESGVMLGTIVLSVPSGWFEPVSS